jgi:predicted DNA-binding transcriptional regulator AlpA
MEQPTHPTSRKRLVRAFDIEANPTALLTVEEVAVHIGFATRTVRQWASEGKYGFPPPQRHGRAIRWLARDLLRWVHASGRRIAPPAPPTPPA